MTGIPRRVPGVLVETAGDEWVAYVRSSDTAHAMNASAGALFHLVDGERSVDELADMVGVDVEVALLGVQELAEAGLVTFDSVEVGATSRRQLLKKIGVGTAAAAALPIVETIVAPTRAAAMSGEPPETDPPMMTDPPMTDPPMTDPPMDTGPLTKFTVQVNARELGVVTVVAFSPDGVGPYTYTSSPEAGDLETVSENPGVSASGLFEDVPPGDHAFTVTDANGRTQTFDVVIPAVIPVEAARMVCASPGFAIVSLSNVFLRGTSASSENPGDLLFSDPESGNFQYDDVPNGTHTYTFTHPLGYTVTVEVVVDC